MSAPSDNKMKPEHIKLVCDTLGVDYSNGAFFFNYTGNFAFQLDQVEELIVSISKSSRTEYMDICEQLSSQLADARAELEIAKGEIKSLSEPDYYFIDSDDDAISNIDDCLDDRGFNVGEVVKIYCTKSLPSITIELVGIKRTAKGRYDGFEYVIKEAE